MKIRKKYVIYSIFLTYYAIVYILVSTGVLSNRDRILLLKLTIVLVAFTLHINIPMLIDILGVLLTPVRILYRLGHSLYMKLPKLMRAVMEKTVIVAWCLFVYGGMVYINIDGRMERYNSGRVPDDRKPAYRASSILQELSYRVYEHVNPSPFDDYVENCLNKTQLQNNRDFACDLVKKKLGSRYTVHTDGYNIYIQYDFFHRDSINHPVSLLRKKIPVIDMNVGDFLVSRGFTAAIFRDTHWYEHLRHGPLVVPLARHRKE